MGVVWGGGGNVFLAFMLFPAFVELFFLVKWEVVSPNSRYREFEHDRGVAWIFEVVRRILIVCD